MAARSRAAVRPHAAADGRQVVVGQRLHEIDTARLQRRDEPADGDRRQRRRRGRERDAPVERDVAHTWKVGWQDRWQQRDQQPRARHSEHAAGDADDGTLRQPLTRQPRSACAERRPDRHFAAPLRDAGELHRRDAGHRRAEEQQDGSEQYANRRTNLGDDGVERGRGGDRRWIAAAEQRERGRARIACGSSARGAFSSDLRRCNTWPHPCDGAEDLQRDATPVVAVHLRHV